MAGAISLPGDFSPRAGQRHTRSRRVPSATGVMRFLVSIGGSASIRATTLTPSTNSVNDHPLPGVVLVAGAGEGTADGWGRWPAAIAGCGAVVLARRGACLGRRAGATDRCFDPATVLPKVRCRVFAAFGGADTSVPVARSAAILSQLLPANPQHALAVFPDGDHNLFITERNEDTPLGSQLAPGFMPMLDTWLNTT